MSSASKVTLVATVGFTISTICLVHLSQTWEQQRLRGGVLRDIEKERMKIQNLKLLQDNIELTKVLKEKRDQETRRYAD